MPKRAITQLFLDKIKSPKSGRVEYWDQHQPGLHLRLSATGKAVWAVMYRVKGKQHRQTLGSLSAIPRVDEARRLAHDAMRLARTGVNPVEERREAKERAAANTVKAAVEQYMKVCERDLRPVTSYGYWQIFAQDVLPHWADRPLSEISKKDVLELISDRAEKRNRKHRHLSGGATVQANRVLARLKTFFAWCVAKNLIAANPTEGIRRTAKEVERERFLSDAEIKAFWAATATLDSERVPFGALFRMLLLTAQRKNEVAGMRWSEIDEHVWTIPTIRAKNKKAHMVHLSESAQAILAGLKRKGDLVFSADGRTAVPSYTRAKDRLDAFMLEKLVALPAWVIHDLRRTATTGMARIGIPPHVADRVLNHTAGTIKGVARVYNRFEYLPERKAALQAWGNFVNTLVNEDATANVVPIRRA